MLTPMKAIRAKCLDCCCGSSNEVKLCPCSDCSLHPYRFGKNPNISRAYTEEQRAAFGAKMKSINSSRFSLVQRGDSEHNPFQEGKNTTQEGRPSDG